MQLIATDDGCWQVLRSLIHVMFVYFEESCISGVRVVWRFTMLVSSSRFFESAVMCVWGYGVGLRGVMAGFQGCSAVLGGCQNLFRVHGKEVCFAHVTVSILSVVV